MPPPGRRTVARLASFAAAIDDLSQREERAGVALAALEKSLAKHPQHGMAVPGYPGNYRCTVLQFEDRGSYRIVYWYDEEQVELVELKRVPTGPFDTVSGED